MPTNDAILGCAPRDPDDSPATPVEHLKGSDRGRSRPQTVLDLQRRAGNRAVGALLARAPAIEVRVELRTQPKRPEQRHRMGAGVRGAGGNGGRVNKRILEKLDRVMSALQNPKRYAEVLGEAFEMVKRGSASDINEALLAMANSGKSRVTSVGAIRPGGPFFRDVVSKKEYWVDHALAGEDHGEMTRLLHSSTHSASACARSPSAASRNPGP